MFYTDLHAYNQATDSCDEPVNVCLSASIVRSIIDRLHEPESQHLNVVLNDLSGKHAVKLEWSVKEAAFNCSVDGVQAGNIFYDELVSSLSCELGANVVACRVLLCSDMDFDVRGAVDLDSGAIHVYSSKQCIYGMVASVYNPELKNYDTLVLNGATGTSLDLPIKDVRVTKESRAALLGDQFVKAPNASKPDSDFSSAGSPMSNLNSIVESCNAYKAELPSVQHKGLR